MVDDKTNKNTDDDWLDELTDEKSVEESAAIDQAAIDALMAGNDTPAPQETAATQTEDETGEIDQSDIDALLNADDAATTETTTDTKTNSPSQEEMDQIFNKTNNTTAKEVESNPADDSLAEIFTNDDDNKNEQTDEAFALGMNESGFGDDDDFNFEDELDDIPEIPDDETEDNVTKIQTKKSPNMPNTIEEKQELPETEDNKGPKLKFTIPVISKTIIAAAGSSLLLLLIIGGWFFMFRGDPEEIAAIIIPEEMQQIAETAPATEETKILPAINQPPVAVGAKLQMADEAGGTVAVFLAGHDADNNPLHFIITTPPEHGRLSGDIPDLTYLPNKNFPGKDRFEFQVSDGQDDSLPAIVVITGPDLSTTERTIAEPIIIKPTKPIISARNISLTMKSTDELLIDWQQIWQQSNDTPFNKGVTVQITENNLQGKLTRSTPSRYIYRPDKFFSGREIIHYRFRQDGINSKRRQLLIQVKLGSPAPEIHLHPLAKKYMVGETVVLDAAASRDEVRENLMFQWQQIAGVPIRLIPLNDEASIVTFVMPSSFAAEEHQGPVFQLTVTDLTGKSDTKNISLTAKSKREEPLWRGQTGGAIAVEPDLELALGALLPVMNDQ